MLKEPYIYAYKFKFGIYCIIVYSFEKGKQKCAHLNNYIKCIIKNTISFFSKIIMNAE